MRPIIKQLLIGVPFHAFYLVFCFYIIGLALTGAKPIPQPWGIIIFGIIMISIFSSSAYFGQQITNKLVLGESFRRNPFSELKSK